MLYRRQSWNTRPWHALSHYAYLKALINIGALIIETFTLEQSAVCQYYCTYSEQL